MGDVTDDAMRRDVMSNWEAGAEQAIRKDWERDVVESNRTYYEIETDRHACADDLTEDEFDAQAADGEPVILLGKISPREAVILIKNITTVPGVHDYYADYLMQVREILRRLDMKS